MEQRIAVLTYLRLAIMTEYLRWIIVPKIGFHKNSHKAREVDKNGTRDHSGSGVEVISTDSTTPCSSDHTDLHQLCCCTTA